MSDRPDRHTISTACPDDSRIHESHDAFVDGRAHNDNKKPGAAQRAFDDGYDARRRGEPKSANPYDPDENEEFYTSCHWDDGWEFGDPEHDEPDIGAPDLTLIP